MGPKKERQGFRLAALVLLACRFESRDLSLDQLDIRRRVVAPSVSVAYPR